MTTNHTPAPDYGETIYRCRTCGGITQTEGLSCDCSVPASHDFEKGFAIFGLSDPEAAIKSAREALREIAEYCPDEWRNPTFEDGYMKVNSAHLVKAFEAFNLLTPKP